MAACAHAAGAACYRRLPIVPDDEDALASAVKEAWQDADDFVVTTGGASNGDFFDFIKPVVGAPRHPST